jgi:crotonobetainyl-CoA:carnitine CoA-transferase CaiB-like acyl-CoA transferase
MMLHAGPVCGMSLTLKPRRKSMKALRGLRLLDLTHYLSGPYASMMLADLGMETIKIEPPGTGEGTRRLLADDPRFSSKGIGAYFLTLNRNKKSLTLDLKSETGQAIFRELVAVSDVVLDNFSAGVMARLGFDHDTLSAINPRIITCSVTGFGETGPNRDWVAFDLVAQAMGGSMSICGRPGDPPTRAGVATGDIGGGLMAVIGVLAALVSRGQTGRGQHVDISMLDAQISLLNYEVTKYYLSGLLPRQSGNGHFLHVPYNAYPCRDGWIVVAVIIDPFWKAVVAALGLADLDTGENETPPGRSRNQAVIDARLGEVFQTDTVEHWLDVLRAARVPCAPVYDVGQALANPQVAHRQMVVEAPHPLGGTVRVPGNPVRLSEHEDAFSAPPLLGQHTDEILHDLLGRTCEEIAALRAAGVV